MYTKNSVFLTPMAEFESKELLALARLRQNGNDAYKSGDLLRAIQLYTEVIDSIPGADTDSLHPTEYPDIVLALGNRAACHLSLKNYSTAAADAKAALKGHPNNDKYHYRLISALREQGLEQECANALGVALKACPESKALYKLQKIAAPVATTTKTRKSKSKKTLSNATVAWGSGLGTGPLYCESVAGTETEERMGALLVETVSGTAYT